MRCPGLRVFGVFSLRCLPIISRSNKNSAVNNAARCIHEEAPASLLLFSILWVHVFFQLVMCFFSEFWDLSWKEVVVLCQWVEYVKLQVYFQQSQLCNNNMYTILIQFTYNVEPQWDGIIDANSDIDISEKSIYW